MDTPICEAIGTNAPPVLVDIEAAANRAHAAMLGAALGDAFGAAVEFMTPSEIAAKHGVLKDIVGGGWLNLKPGQVTDDTQMSLCIARSIATVGWSPSDIASRFGAWLKSRPIDVGNTCRRGIRRYLLEGTVAGAFHEGDAGNGAAMRMAPVAIASLGDESRLDRLAVEQAHITHHHPLSDAACKLVGRLVQFGCLGERRERLCAEAERVVQRMPAFRYRPYRGLATTYVVDTIQTVLHAFFETPTFEDCLVTTVNLGGDADTTGAIAGAIAGAHYGLEAIPKRWIRKLDRGVAAEIADLSARLFCRSPLAHRYAAYAASLVGASGQTRRC